MTRWESWVPQLQQSLTPAPSPLLNPIISLLSLAFMFLYPFLPSLNPMANYYTHSFNLTPHNLSPLPLSLGHFQLVSLQPKLNSSLHLFCAWTYPAECRWREIYNPADEFHFKCMTINLSWASAQSSICSPTLLHDYFVCSLISWCQLPTYYFSYPNLPWLIYSSNLQYLLHHLHSW